MKTFILVFGSIFLLLVSSCAPATAGTTNANPIKVGFSRNPIETESVNVTAGETVYVQTEKPADFFELNNNKLRQLDEKLEIDFNTSENEIYVTGVSSWFTLVDYQLLYNANGELATVDDENWNIELKKTIARREIEKVGKDLPRSDTINIRYSDLFDFVFAITPDSQSGGEYFVVLAVKVQNGETVEVLLRFQVPSNKIPKKLPKEIS